MKYKKVICLFFIIVTSIILLSCNYASDYKELDISNTLVDFTKGESDLFKSTNGYATKGAFYNINVFYNKDNVIYDDCLRLVITKNKLNEGGSAYYSSQIESLDTYSFGDYSIVMKPEKLEGIKTSFYTYIGKEDNVQTEGIEITFNGNDTTKINFNYYSKSNTNHSVTYNLGFDASLDFHNYGFRWNNDGVLFFVDKKLMHQEKTSPSLDGKIYLNNYCELNSTFPWVEKPAEELLNNGVEFKSISYVKA